MMFISSTKQFRYIRLLDLPSEYISYTKTFQNCNLIRGINFMLNFGTEFKTNLKKLCFIVLKKVRKTKYF